MQASGVASDDLLLIVDTNEPDVNERSKRIAASGLASYVFARLSSDGADERFYVDEPNSQQDGFFNVLGVNTISGNTTSSGNLVAFASGVRVTVENFQNQNLIVQSTSAPTDSGTIFWYRPPISGLLGRSYYRYVNPTGVGPSAVEWVEASPFEATTIQIGTQQVISGIFNPLRIPAATNATSGYGGIQFTDELGKYLNASGTYEYIPVVTSGIVGGVPTISGVQEGLPLVKQGNTVAYVQISGVAVNADFSSQQIRAGLGSVSAPSYTFTGDLNTGLYSPAADQVGITVSGTQKVRFENTLITFSGNVNLNNGTLTTQSDITVNSVDIGLGGGNLSGNLRIGDQALGGNTTGDTNIAIGYQSLSLNQTGGSNTAVGYQSLLNSTASRNSAYGAYALQTLTNGEFNSAFGYSSLNQASSSQYNTGFGYNTLYSTTGSYNTALGGEAGRDNVGGQYNVLLGYNAGRALTTGDSNTIIGNVQGSAGLANTVIIAAGSAEKIKVDSSNNVFLTGTIKTISGGTTGVPIYTTSGDADTGISFPAANTIALSASGLGQVAVDINRVTVSGTFLATTISGTTVTSTLGTSSAPSYSFSGDLNTGIFSPAADRVSIAASGLGKLAVDINRTTVSGTFFADTVSGTVVTAALGSVTAPSFSFSGDLNTGLYSPSADVIAITSSGQQVVRFQSDLSSTFAGAVNIGGILSAGVYVPTSNTVPTNGMYLPATDILGFATASTERLRIDTNGNIKVGGSVDRATTAGTKQVILYDGTAPAGTLASGVSLYSTLGVLNAMDATGSGVTLAPYIRTPIGGLSSMAIGPNGSNTTGFYYPNTTSVAIVASGLAKVSVDTNRTSVSGTFYADTVSGTTFAATLGTATAPTYSFSGDLNTGLFSPASDRVAITASGLTKLAVDINRTTVSGTFYADTVSGTVITAGLGTQSAPGFTFSGDINTGIFSPLPDVLAFTTAGVARMSVEESRVTVSGVLYSTTFSGLNILTGLGTAGAPAISPIGGTNTGIFYPDTSTVALSTGGSERLRVDSSGRLLIGTTNARSINAVTSILALEGNTNFQNASISLGHNRADNGAPEFRFFKTRGTTSDSNTITVAGDRLGVTRFFGADGTQLLQAANIEAYVDATPASGIMPGRLVFSTTASGAGATPTERMRIDRNGQITTGLGTAASPVLAPTGGTNTGIFYPDISGVAVSTGGVEAFRVDNSRRLLTGLTAAQAIGSSTWAVQHVAAGIGILRPSNDTSPAAITLGKTRSTTVGSYTIVQNNDLTGLIDFAVDDGTDYVSTNARITVAMDGVPGANSVPGRLTFSTTADGASSSTERMRIGSTGAVAIGTTITAGGASGSTLRWANDMTGATTVRSIYGTPTIQSDVTINATLYETSPSTAASAFTVTSLFHYAATQGTIGASSAITNQYGFSANGSLIGATNNYGFFGNIPAASGRWNFYANGTAANYFAGATQTALGTAAAPSLTPIGGTNTGIFYPDTSTVAVSTGGSERLRVESKVFINSSIWPGQIGVTSPTFAVCETGTQSNMVVAKARTSSSGPAIQLLKTRAASIGTNTVVADGDELGLVRFAGADGTNYIEGARLSAEVDGPPGASDMPGRLLFSTTSDGASSVTERARITNAGNFKIGGTANRATTEGTNQLVLFDGTAPVGTLANGVSLYSSAGELTALSASGSAVTLAPQIRTPLGSASTTAIAPAGGTDTGIFYPDTSTVAVSISGSEISRLTSTGIGIGGPPSARVHAIGSSGSASPTPVEVRIQTTTSASDWSTTSPWGRLSFHTSDASDGGAKTVVALDSVAANVNGGVGYLSIKVAQSTSGSLDEKYTADRFGIFRIGGSANTNRSTTAGTNQLVIFDGTAPVGTLSNGVSLYSSAGELTALSASGSAVTLAPQIRTPLGSASTTAIAPAGGTDTGIFYPDTSTVAVSTGGVEAFRVNSNRSLLIGSSVAPLIESINLRLCLSSVGGSTNAQDLGILNFQNAGGSGRTRASAKLFFGKSRSASAGSAGGIVASNDNLGEIRFVGDDGTAFQPAVDIICAATGTPASGSVPGELRIALTADGGSVPTEKYRLCNTGNLKIGGTANRATTEGTNQLVIFNGTAPVGTLTNGVSLYSATGELRVMDAAGNSTLLSPHDHETNEWVYDSTDTTTGKRLRINMEKMMKFLNDYFGLDFVQETFVQP